MLVEICVSSIEDVKTVDASKADRIELCSTMEVIGVTPSLGMYLLAKEITDKPLVVMLRPRAGFYNYSDLEFEVMKRDLKMFYDYGAREFVFGICDENGEIDVERCDMLMRSVPNDCKFTYHKAFDYVNDKQVGIKQLIDLGFDRVLTSGGLGSTNEYLDDLKNLIDEYKDEIEIIVGGGVRHDNIEVIHSKLNHDVYHLSAKHLAGNQMQHIETDEKHLSMFMDKLQRIDMKVDV